MKRCCLCGSVWDGARWICPRCAHGPAELDGFLCFAPDLARDVEGYDPGHFAHLAALETGSFWFRARNRLIDTALARFGPQHGEFLEIGCGTGFVLEAVARSFPGLNVRGSDVLVEGLTHASTRVDRARLVQMDARSIPFAEEFDGIGLFDVIEHVPDDAGVLQEIHRALRPDGRLILTVPQHMRLWSSADSKAGHLRRYSRQEIESVLVRSGFTILMTTSFVTLPLPALAVARRLRPRPDVLAELKLPRVVDRLFDGLMRLEGRAIRAGISLPAGGSLLVVAARSRS